MFIEGLLAGIVVYMILNMYVADIDNMCGLVLYYVALSIIIYVSISGIRMHTQLLSDMNNNLKNITYI